MRRLILALPLLLCPALAEAKDNRSADGLFSLPIVCGSLSAIQELYDTNTSPQRQVDLMNSACRVVETSTSYYVGAANGTYVLIEMYRLKAGEPRQSLGSWWILRDEALHYAIGK